MHGIADFVDIAGADALLNVAKTLSERVRRAEKIRHKRVHSGCREKNGRVVVRDQRRALDYGVPFALEEFEKLRS